MKVVLVMAIVATVFVLLFVASYAMTRNCFSTHGPPEQLSPGVTVYTETGKACTVTWRWKTHG